MTSTIIIKQSEASTAEVTCQSLIDTIIVDSSNDLPKVMRDSANAYAGLEFIQL